MERLYLITYFLLWVATFIIYWHRKRVLDVGWIILCAYVGCTGMSLWLFNLPPVYYEFEPLRLFPFFYLFGMILLALWPVLRFDSNKITSIEQPNMRVLDVIVCLVILFSIAYIPSVLDVVRENKISQLFSNSETGSEMYIESMMEAEDRGSKITNLPSIIVNIFSDITILLLFYYLSLPKKKWLLILGLLASSFLYVITPIFNGQRGNVIIAVLTFIVAYFLMRTYFSTRLRKWIDILGVALIVSVSVPVIAITMSRFSWRDGGAIGSVVYYMGQAPLNFNNYGLDAGGIRNGDRTFNLAKRLIDPSTPKNYVERREKYFDLKMDDNIFYTFVGDFTLDFGPYIAPLIFILFTIFVIRGTRPRENQIAFHQLLLIYLVACICMQGSFYLFAYADTAGLRVVVLFMLYFLLKYSSNQSDKKTQSLCQD